jgi:transposase
MTKRKFSSEYKVKLVLEALRGEKTLGEIASEHELNPNQLTNWKREFLERAPSLFNETRQERETRKSTRDAEAEKARMLKKIGQLTMERDYLKAATDDLSDRGLL